MARADFPLPVRNLVAELKRLPGVGPRSAERMAVWLLQHKKSDPLALAESLVEAREKIIACPICGFFATEETCEVCSDPKRDDTVLCVVEQATDVLPLERSGAFKGRYHCLGGKLSPLDRVSPEDLNIPELMRRVETGGGDGSHPRPGGGRGRRGDVELSRRHVAWKSREGDPYRAGAAGGRRSGARRRAHSRQGIAG